MPDDRSSRAGPEPLIRIEDLGQWVMLKNSGTVWQLLGAHTFLEDAEGALEAGQLGALAFATRELLHVCLSIRGCARGGSLGNRTHLLSLTQDPFSHAEPGETRAAKELLDQVPRLDGEEQRQAWLDRLRSFVRDTERALGHREALAPFRSPAGLPALLNHARTWDRLARELGLPPSLPENWGKGRA